MKQKNPKSMSEKETKSLLFDGTVPCGFPSPADDYLGQPIDLNHHLIKHPAATFFVKVEGESMVGAGICSGDLLIVDRARIPKAEDIVLAVVGSDFTVKRLRKRGDRIVLVAENEKCSFPEISEEAFQIWGVVTYAIRDLYS